ncbi:MAG TPA: SAM-dependent methyltransferase, partial [Burkholderiales bacterium]|nr:SAM-dependent methyltransferase [Burkholderiales bacterium]
MTATNFLYAIPTPLGGAPHAVLSPAVLEIVCGLRDYVAEDGKSARAFLAAAGAKPREVSIRELNEHTDPSAVEDLLQPLREGRPLGLLSEAGCPAIADPGAALVEAAQREGFRVVPLAGPSSLTLALMASGLEGQRFAFCGYLPRDAAERGKRIRELEARSRREKETEIFIETPYRNEALFAALVQTCAPQTRLCIAADLTLEGESVRTKTIAEWRRSGAAPGRRPAVFLLL